MLPGGAILQVSLKDIKESKKPPIGLRRTVFSKAGRTGFEPAVPFRVQLLSRQPQSTTLAPPRGRIIKAEGEGFEPPVGLSPTAVFKTAALVHSAIPPVSGGNPSRAQKFYHICWRAATQALKMCAAAALMLYLSHPANKIIISISPILRQLPDE